jgi:DNA repair protein RadC
MKLSESLTPNERPRERLAQHGADALTDAELLALLIGSGVKGRNAVALSTDLLTQTGGLRGLQRLGLRDLGKLTGMGPARASLVTAAFELGVRASLAQIRASDPIKNPSDIRAHCRLVLSNLAVEHCAALWLDSQNRLIDYSELAIGTLNQTAVYTREVIAQALKHRASGMILTHNHPHGSTEPSSQDVQLTQALAQALAVIDVHLFDHIIVAGHETVSMAALGYQW